MNTCQITCSQQFKDGMTVLHLAAKGGHTSAVRLLLEKQKLDVNAKVCTILHTLLESSACCGKSNRLVTSRVEDFVCSASILFNFSSPVCYVIFIDCKVLYLLS